MPGAGRRERGDAVLVECVPALCAPTGPGDPFGEPVLVVVDSLRVTASALSVFLVAVCGRAVGDRSLPPTQRVRFAALAVLFASTLATELAHLGDYPHYRFLLNLAGVALGVVGLTGPRRTDAEAGRHAR